MKKTWEILNYSLNPGAVFRKRDSGLEKKSRNPLCLKSYLWHLDTISSWLGSTFLSQAVQSSKNPSSSLHLPFSPPLSSITLPLLLFLPPLSAPLFFYSFIWSFLRSCTRSVLILPLVPHFQERSPVCLGALLHSLLHLFSHAELAVC